MGRKIDPTAYRLNHPYTPAPGLSIQPKTGLGHHLGGWITTTYGNEKPSTHRASTLATRLRNLVEEWCSSRAYLPTADGTYVLATPVYITTHQGMLTLDVQIIKVGKGLRLDLSALKAKTLTPSDASTPAATQTPTPLPQTSSSVPISAPTATPSVDIQTFFRHSLLRQRNLYLPTTLYTLNRTTKAPLALPLDLASLPDVLDDMTRVSPDNLVALLYTARTSPRAHAVSRTVAIALEDATGQQQFRTKLQTVFTALDALPGHERISRSCGYEIDVRGTIDGARRTMSTVIRGGKLSRGTVTVPTSHSETVAKTKTGTRGIKVLYSFSGDRRRVS